ncbi:PAS domain-containing protein [Salipiger sp. IMCC34102]|uniref:PAS domain-containing protein n=1 Tax=Salipiger sp. IMCC34102 TaxID=2510647 RepID=UPI00101BBA59|nr:PAS domain-containing protein [Salipiger sp. IMCC34102]RYH03154.1 PAS domain-containing protein [Salipiger sp. IMCC34102]
MFTPYPVTPASHRRTPRLSDRARLLLSEVERDWRAVTGLDQDPAKTGSAELQEALPHCFVLGRNAAGILRVRVAGQKLHDALRHDPRGASFGTLFADPGRETILGLMDTVLDTPAIMELPLVVHRGLARRSISAALLALPLRDADGEISKIMGAIVPSEPLAGGSAVRFDLATDRTIRHEPLKHGLVERRRNGRGAPVPPRPALRLVVNNG